MEYAVDGDGRQVTAWSTKRLAFEPKGWQVAFRADLRAALRSLRPQRGRGLVVTYATPDQGFVDLENVLLYNVGQGCISHLLDDGLSCRRITSPDGLHHVRYQVAGLPGQSTAVPVGHVDSTWQGPLPISVAEWWAQLRPGTRAAAMQEELPRFDLDVTLTGPGLSGVRMGGALKSLLDGLVACFNAHDGSNHDRLADLIFVSGPGDTTWRSLCDTSTALLGVRPLIRTYRGGLAWNPADERCDAFTIRPSSSERWALQANVHGVSTRR